MDLNGPFANSPNASITGLKHTTEEESNTYFWNFFRKRTNEILKQFFEKSFPYNFCPLKKSSLNDPKTGLPSKIT